MDGAGRPSRRPGRRPLLDLLGMAARAGMLVSGTQAVRNAARERKVYQVVVAEDAAAGQRAKLTPLLEARRIPYHIAFTQEELGAATGRAPVSAVGFSNPQMAKRAAELLMELPSSKDQQGGS